MTPSTPRKDQAETPAGAHEAKRSFEKRLIQVDVPLIAGRIEPGSADELDELAERGDLGGMSFGFRVPKGGERWDGEHRTLLTVELAEVSVVSSWPAYEGTHVEARSRVAVLPVKLALAKRYLETL